MAKIINPQLSFSENGSDEDVAEESSDDPSSTTEPNPSNTEETRDEVKEVKELAKKDTRRIRMWRFIVTGALVATSTAVTISTYRFLANEETHKFETAFDQFSKTILDSAVAQHENRLEAYSSLADIMSSVALMNNETWPFFTFPRFEHFGYNAIKQSRTEIVNIVHKVTNANQAKWVEYANKNYEKWLTEGYEIESKKYGDSVYDNIEFGDYHPYITKKEETFVPREERDVYWTSWVYSPPPVKDGFINWDFTSDPLYDKIIASIAYMKNETLFTPVKHYVSAGIAFTKAEHDAMHSARLETVTAELPHAFLFHPILADPEDVDSEIVAVICSGIAWDNSLLNLLPPEVWGLYVVIENTCDQQYTFVLNGPDATFLGEGDHHDPSYDSMHKSVTFRPRQTHPEYDTIGGHCIYSMSIYASGEFEDIWDDNTSVVFAAVVATTFLIVTVVFFIYDIMVQLRNDKLVERAARTTAIVSNLFPGQFRDEMIATSKLRNDTKAKGNGFLAADSPDENEAKENLPLAKCYPDVTILFADIVGFTKWSSPKEPVQVFALLESLYNSFDEIAQARRIFKVETVGDCYVAASGLPTPMPHHAVAMCRFARNIRSSMHVLVRDLVDSLGDDTANLDLRIGIHSGSVTAGVIRGQKARFQLFGDTMNTCSRVETTGKGGEIHVSKSTADLLKASGKGNWVTPREDCVVAKGKGELETFWLTADQAQSSTSNSTRSGKSDSSGGDGDPLELSSPEDDFRLTNSTPISSALIDWSVDTLVRLLSNIEDQRSGESAPQPYSVLAERARTHQMERAFISGNSIDEFRDVLQIPLPKTSAIPSDNGRGTNLVPSNVVDQLQLYITCIANMHRAEDRFHTFEHAVWVAHSVQTLMSRWKEPWTPFGCVWAALVHHVDHPGHGAVDSTTLSAAYGHRVVAEQNALQLSWQLLLGDNKFRDLRHFLYKTTSELEYFRQVTVHAVLSTDHFDKDLQLAREERWRKAFASKETASQANDEDHRNLEATAVMDIVMQVSTARHAMQNWETYRLWNNRLFIECYSAFRDGRIPSNPADAWFDTELGFFDRHIIPLAKRLEVAFKVLKKERLGDKYLVRALKNREEWRNQGVQLVSGLVQKVDESRASF